MKREAEMLNSKGADWVPEIMYEEAEDGVSSQIPFVMVPENQSMPEMLYVFESRATGEFEPGVDGEEVPVVQWDLHQYADMLVLKDGLPSPVYDMVRQVLGLEPLAVASMKGQKITENVRGNLNNE